MLAGTALTGLFSVVVQVLVPFAATLAAPERRGKVVGTVMSGLLLGILLARTVAGALANLGSWRIVYWVGGAGMILVAAAVLQPRPAAAPRAAGAAYPQLMHSMAPCSGRSRCCACGRCWAPAAFGPSASCGPP